MCSMVSFAVVNKLYAGANHSNGGLLGGGGSRGAGERETACTRVYTGTSETAIARRYCGRGEERAERSARARVFTSFTCAMRRVARESCATRYTRSAARAHNKREREGVSCWHSAAFALRSPSREREKERRG